MTYKENKTHEENLEKLLALLSRFRILNVQLVQQAFPHWQPDFAVLAKAGAIHFWPAPTTTGAMQHLLALARGGAAILAAKRGCEIADVPYLRPAELKRSLFTLEHTLAIAELGLALEKLAEVEPRFKLLRLETSPTRIGASVRLIRDGEFWSVPLVADALVEASFEGKRHTFLVEIDRGTTTYARMKRKFIGYHRWWKEHGPFLRFGVANLRLLVFTSSDARLKVLRRSIEEHIRGGAGFIWFSLLEHISVAEPTKLLSPIWRCARRGPITVKPGRVVKVDSLLSLFDRPPGPGAPP